VQVQVQVQAQAAVRARGGSRGCGVGEKRGEGRARGRAGGGGRSGTMVLSPRQKHQRKAVVVAVLNVIVVSLAVLSVTWTAVWIDFAGVNALPSRINVFRRTLENAQFEPAVEGLLYFLGVYATSVAAGWPAENNAVRISGSVMVLIAAWFTFLIAVNFMSRRVALILLLCWSIVELMLVTTAAALDGIVLVDTLEQCRSVSCPNLIERSNAYLCECQPNGFAWSMFGVDIALAVGIFLLVAIYAVTLCTGVPEDDQMYSDVDYGHTGKSLRQSELEVDEFNDRSALGDSYASDNAAYHQSGGAY